MAQEKTKRVFGSKHANYMLVLDGGGPRWDETNKMYIPNLPFHGIQFNDGVYATSSEREIEFLLNHPEYGRDFWEILKPEDVQKVHTGRHLEVTGSAKGTTSSRPGKK